MKRPDRVALLMVVAGVLLAVAGTAMFSMPLALILAGAAIAGLGLFAIEVRP